MNEFEMAPVRGPKLFPYSSFLEARERERQIFEKIDILWEYEWLWEGTCDPTVGWRGPKLIPELLFLKNVRNCHFAIVRHLNRLFAYQKLNVSKWRCTSFYFLRFSLGLPWPLIPNAKRTLRTMNLYRPTASWCPAKSSTDTLTWPKIAWST